MELRIVLRGALSGAFAGLLGFVFATIFAEPLIDRAITYEAGRTAVLDQLNVAAGRTTSAEGPEIFSRTIQSTVGAATGVVAFSAAMGALVAVAYVVLHGRFGVQPRTTAWLIAGFGFLGIYALPFAKYPANPPAIGHDFTIGTRGTLYLTLVAASLILLGLAFALARRLQRTMTQVAATVTAAVAFLVVFGVLVGLLPSLGHLSANVAASTDFGFARAATETPQPITNILSKALTIDGRQYAPGQIVYPGFDADLLWKFRWYAILNQLLIWTTIALVFGTLLQRFLSGPAEKPAPAGGRPADLAAAR